MKQIFNLYLSSILILLAYFSPHPIFGQLSWSEQTSGVSVPLVCASAVDLQNGWACGYNGTVLRTSNQGNTWLNVSGGGIPQSTQLVTIYGYSGTTAVTAGNIGSDTYAFRTTNGGATWVQVFFQPNGFIDCIDNNFLQGDPVGGRWSLWKTTNNGAAWDSSGLYLPESSGDLGWSNSFYTDGNSIWFGTSNTRIYYSTSGGTSWQVQPTSTNIVTQSIWMRTPVGFSVEQSVLKTTNNGINWVSAGSVGTGFWVSISGVPQSNGAIIIARGGTIYLSTNDGASWSPVHSSSGNYRNISLVRSLTTSIWAVRDNGGISVSQVQPNSIRQISGEVPKTFTIWQNYPNPFNPSTKIKFDVPANMEGQTLNVKLIIYDLLGKEAVVLVNQELKAGVYEVSWNAGAYPSGIYFYTLTAGNYTQTKKMVLLK